MPKANREVERIGLGNISEVPGLTPGKRSAHAEEVGMLKIEKFPDAGKLQVSGLKTHYVEAGLRTSKFPRAEHVIGLAPTKVKRKAYSYEDDLGGVESVPGLSHEKKE